MAGRSSRIPESVLVWEPVLAWGPVLGLNPASPGVGRASDDR